MKNQNKKPTYGDKIYYEQICTKYRTIFIVNFNHGLYDKILVCPNYSEGVTYDDIIKRLREIYKIVFIGTKETPTKGADDALLVTSFERRRDNIEEDFLEPSLFTLLVNKKFVIRNKNNFLDLLMKLVSEHFISYVAGKISYDINDEHFFINLNVAFRSKVPKFMPKIYYNYNNIKCLFKHKRDDKVTLFCETKSRKYLIDTEHDECLNYIFNFIEDGNHKYWTSGAYIYVNFTGNVRIDHASEKLSVLTKEIYAKNLDEGLQVLRNEMKNLGLEIEIIGDSKRKIWVR